MLRINNRNQNFNAISIINDIQIASFSANVNDPDNNFYISVNVDNKANFITNLATVKADLESFIDEILEIND